jgi:PIN domain nuclease of toxin-antitoxin system
MRLLVDTHVLLWAIAEPARIPKDARERLESIDNEVLFSAASIWELAIKTQIGKLALPVSLEKLSMIAQSMGFAELPVTAAHAAGVAALPLHHRDPFDRLLISQAIAEPARLLTVDETLVQYSELVELLTPRPS